MGACSCPTPMITVGGRKTNGLMRNSDFCLAFALASYFRKKKVAEMHCTLTSGKVGHEAGEACEPVSVELYRHRVGGSLLCTE